jgi:putative membrane protein
LPPEQITTRAARVAGLEAHPEAPGWEWKTFAGHFSYGTAVGALYGLIRPRRGATVGATIANGCAYGLAVWTLSYLGWLPAARILPPATREPARRNAVMIVAHLIWGTTLALLAESEEGRVRRVTRRVDRAIRAGAG